MNLKMDKTLSRKATDIEQKYNLGQLTTAPGSSAKLELLIKQINSTLEQYMTNFNKKIEMLESEIEALRDAEATQTYLVTFYDANKVVVVSYTVKQGESVNSPLTDVTWVNSEGETVTFPYTPTSDTNLYVYQESTQ